MVGNRSYVENIRQTKQAILGPYPQRQIRKKPYIEGDESPGSPICVPSLYEPSSQ